MPAEYKVDVNIDPSKARAGAAEAGKALDDVAKHGKDLELTLAHVFEFYAVKEAVTELIHLGDAYTGIQNKLRSVATSQSNLNALSEATFQVAQDTRMEWDEVANVYQRVAKATEHLGYTQKDVLDLTQTITQALIVAGATQQEAAMSLMEITHGFELGVLTGREFRVLLKDMTPVITPLAKALGMTRSEFVELGKHGKLTAQMLGTAFKNAAPEIQAAFEKMVPTIAQSFTALENAAKKFFGESGTDSGVLGGISNAIMFVAHHFEEFGKVILALIQVLGVYFAIQGVGVAISAIKALGVAVMANPLMALLLALTGAVALLRQFGDQIALTTTTMNGTQVVVHTLGDAFRAIWDELVRAKDAVIEFLHEGWDMLTQAFSDGIDTAGISFSLNDALHLIMSFAYAAVEIFQHFKDIAVIVFGAIPVALVEAFSNAFPEVVKILEAIVNKVIDAINNIKNLGTAIKGTIENDAKVLLMKQQSDVFSQMQETKGEINSGFLSGDNLTNAQRHLADLTKDYEIYHKAIVASGSDAKLDLLPHVELDKEAIKGAGAAAKQMIDDNIKDIQDGIKYRLDTFDKEIADKAKERLLTGDKGGLNDKGETPEGRHATDKEIKAYEKLQNQLRQLIATINPIEAAEKKLADAEDITTRAVQSHMITEEQRLDIMERVKHHLENQLHPYEALVKKIGEENNLLALSGRQLETATKVRAYQNQLIKAGIEPTEAMNEELLKLINQGEDWEKQVKEHDEAMKSLTAGIDQYGKQVRKMAEDYKKAMDEYNTNSTMAGGAIDGLKRIRENVMAVGKDVSNMLYDVYSGLSNLLTDFIVKGKADWSAFFTEIAMDLERILLKKALIEIGTTVGLPGFATGGQFVVGGNGGTDSQTVAFRATPGERVTIDTPGQAARGGTSGGGGGGASPVYLKNVNVTDPRQAVGAVDSAAGERVFMNMIRRNPGLLRGLTGTRR